MENQKPISAVLGFSLLELYLKPFHRINTTWYKIYTRRGIQVPDFNGLFFLFPYLDVFLGDEDNNGSTVRVWNVHYLRSDLWPAVHRPFCGMFPYAPSNARAVIAREYGALAGDVECRLHPNHFNFTNRVRVACKAKFAELHEIFPFVFCTQVTMKNARNETITGVLEELKGGSRVIQQVLALDT